MKLLNFSEKAAKFLEPSLRETMLDILNAELRPFRALTIAIEKAVVEQVAHVVNSRERSLKGWVEVQLSEAQLRIDKQGFLETVRTLATNVARSEARNITTSGGPAWAAEAKEWKRRSDLQAERLKVVEHHVEKLLEAVAEAAKHRDGIEVELERHQDQIDALKTNAANGFDMHASKLRDIMDERITVRIQALRETKPLKRCPNRGCTYWEGHKGDCDGAILCWCGHDFNSHDHNEKCRVARTDSSTNYKTVKCDCPGFRETELGA
jgi:hypothetical protein